MTCATNNMHAYHFLSASTTVIWMMRASCLPKWPMNSEKHASLSLCQTVLYQPTSCDPCCYAYMQFLLFTSLIPLNSTSVLTNSRTCTDTARISVRSRLCLSITSSFEPHQSCLATKCASTNIGEITRFHCIGFITAGFWAASVQVTYALIFTAFTKVHGTL